MTSQQVETNYIRRKYRVIGVTKLSAADQTFPMQFENQEPFQENVMDFYQEKYGITLRLVSFFK